MTDARREGYWSDVEDTPTLRDVIRAKAEGDGWSVHSLVLSGSEDGTLFVLVVRSAVRDSGLILSERYMTVPEDATDESDLSWSSNGIERRIGGDLPQALIRSYARVSNDRLAADDLDDPVVMDARDADVENDPDELTTPISPDKGRSIDARESRNGPVECEICGESADKSDAVNIGGALGTDYWVHERCQGDE